MSPGVDGQALRAACFPRVSGDEPDAAALGDLTLGFSPRERG